MKNLKRKDSLAINFGGNQKGGSIHSYSSSVTEDDDGGMSDSDVVFSEITDSDVSQK